MTRREIHSADFDLEQGLKIWNMLICFSSPSGALIHLKTTSVILEINLMYQFTYLL